MGLFYRKLRFDFAISVFRRGVELPRLGASENKRGTSTVLLAVLKVLVVAFSSISSISTSGTSSSSSTCLTCVILGRVILKPGVAIHAYLGTLGIYGT